MQTIKNDEPCPSCGRFANRGVSIDAIIVKNDKILLVQRGVEPFKGYWATPGGYVSWDESTEDAVKREVKEETNLEVTETRLVGVYSSPTRHPKQVINLVYLTKIKDGEIKHGDDAVDAKWFALGDIPEQLAFDHKQNIKDAQKLLRLNN